MKPRQIKFAESKLHPYDGKCLRQIRRTHNKTQAQFAAEFEVSVGTIGNYEHGRTEIPLSFWLAVGERYDLALGLLGVDDDLTLSRRWAGSQRSTDKQMARHPKSWRLARMRARTKYFRNEVYSTGRRLVEDIVHSLFFAATLICNVEQVLRALPLTSGNISIYRDIAFVGAFAVMCGLMLPAILSIPWGVKVDIGDENSENSKRK